jgi:16S rRNA processing protein RimM
MPTLVRVGYVRRAIGLRGELALEPLTDRPERFRAGLTVRIGGTAYEIAGVRRTARGVAVKLAGVDDRARADQLRGAYLEVDAGDAEPLPPGSYYHWQLIGLEVFSTTGGKIGDLVDVLAYPANDVYVVRADGQETLVPAVKEIVREIDVDAGRMVVDMPPEVEVR